MNLEIPAGDGGHRHFATYRLPVDTILLDIYPHMHMLGREIKATANLPDGHAKTLVWIKDWSFGWQPRYVFQSPLRLPAGTQINLECVFDNSAANPLNPHSPPRKAYWGEGSDDEMGMCFLQVLTDTAEDFRNVDRRQPGVLPAHIDRLLADLRGTARASNPYRLRRSRFSAIRSAIFDACLGVRTY